MKKIILYTFIALVISCNSNNNSEHYYYLEEDDALDNSAPFGTFVYKSTREFSFSKILISANVTDFNQNSEYVVARQEVDTTLLRKWIHLEIENYIRLRGYNPEINNLSFYDFVLPDSLLLSFENNDSRINHITNMALGSPQIKKLTKNKTNYWIIQKSKDSLIGPLTKFEFETIRTKLDLPDKLNLN